MSITNGSNLGLMVNADDGEAHATAFRQFLRGIDGLVQARVKDKDLTAPPGSPANGDCYIVATGPSGTWSGQAGKIARYNTFTPGWEFYAPKEGWRVAVEDEDHDYRHDGTAWRIIPNIGQATAFIEGLALSRNSGTSISVSTGLAYVEGLSRFVRASSAITKSSLSLSADTWYHVYLFESGGVADAEVVTTAPAAAYSGSARSKTGDTSRRYLGSVRTDGSGNVRDFSMDGNTIRWEADVRASPFRVLAGGTTTSWTSVSLAAVLPVTARSVSAFIQLVGGTIGTDFSTDSASGKFIYTINPAQFASGMFSFDNAGQAIYYKAPVTGAGALYIDVNGYTFTR